MSTTTQPPKPKRRWYQFSLKTLLIVVTLLCVPLAWIGWRMQRARENGAGEAAVREAVAAFERFDGNGDVWFACEGGTPSIWLEREFGDPGIPDLPVGVLIDTDLNDTTGEHLTTLANLTNLRYLHFTGTNITDAGVKKLQQALPNCVIDH